MKEYRVFGPPGTGKTSALATKYVPGSIEKYGRENVMICSFTKTAAREIAAKPSRKTGLPIDIPHSHVGTLHQIAYHALEQPRIIETEKPLIEEWNTAHPHYAITGRSISTMGTMDELYSDKNENGDEDTEAHGDRLLSAVNIKRNRMEPQKRWPQDSMRSFYGKWCEFKKDNMVVDFTDLIEIALRDMIYAPGQPRVLYVDEAQDFSKLQISLCRSWAQHMEFIILVGDDDQAIYGFSGASPDAFLVPPVPAKYKEVLAQSWRVPVKVLERAERLTARIRRREPKKYHPRCDPKTGRPVQGILTESNATWRRPDKLMENILADIDKEQSVMFLASCSYMLEPMKALLKQHALPFANPYRRRRGDWNPLENKATKIIAAFMNRGIDDFYWNVPQLLTWVEQLKVDKELGVKYRTGKKALLVLKDAVLNNEEGLHTTRHILEHVLAPKAVQRALARDTDWLTEYMRAPYNRKLDYPLAVYNKHGQAALDNPPLITLGTIHSVKGSEASSVYLCPDTSLLGNKEFWTGGIDGHDSVLRVFYVGMTRARKKLTLCKAAVRQNVMRRKESRYINL